MRLKFEDWDTVKRYLLYDKKLSDSKKNIDILKSRYRILCAYFEERDFNRTNFLTFLEYMLEKGYSKAYMNVMITIAKHLDKHFGINELQDFSRYPKEDKQFDILTAEEFEAIANTHLHYARESEEINKKYDAIILTLYYTGARINELLTLTWQDLKEEPFPMLVFNQKKVHDIRYAPIPVSLYALLTRLPHYSGLIFSSKDGNVLDRTTVALTLRRRAAACGIDKHVFNHLLRHSFINIMLRNGAGLHQVSRLVGHKTLETTNRHYVHLMISELNDVLHNYHPALKKEQSLATITKRVKDMLTNILDTDKFRLDTKRQNNTVNFNITELDE